MKKFLATFSITMMVGIVYSQTSANENTSFSEILDISYSSKHMVKSIGFGTKRNSDNQQEIGFVFVTKKQARFPSIKLDSITLKSSDNDLLTVNNPQYDTIYTINNEGMSLTVIHLLHSADIKFFKEKKISR